MYSSCGGGTPLMSLIHIAINVILIGAIAAVWLYHPEASLPRTQSNRIKFESQEDNKLDNPLE